MQRAVIGHAPDRRFALTVSAFLLELCAATAAGAQPLSFELDASGRLAAVFDAFGQVTRYLRDPAGRLVLLTYPDGRSNRYRYDAAGRLSELLTEKGRRLSYTYDPQGRWSQVRFPNGDSLRFTPAAGGQGLRVTYPDGTVADFRFDQNRRLQQVATPLLTTTLQYDAAERLKTVSWSDGKAVGLRYDQANRIGALTDRSGKIIDSWGVNLRGAEAGRVLTVADPLELFQIRRDEAGRLSSASSDWGEKAFVHWGTRAGEAHSVTGPWGYVELDARGRPTEVLTPQGTRVSAAWEGSGRLDRITAPLVGDVRLGYGTAQFPVAIQLGDGLRTALPDRETRPTAGGGPRDSGALRQEPIFSRLLEREPSLELRYPAPQLYAAAFLTAHQDRFWSRVESLVELSANRPLPGTKEARRSDDYWTSGKYLASPYYADLQRPFPELTPQKYLTAFVLTVAIEGIDFADFMINVVRVPPIVTFAGQRLAGLRSLVRRPLDQIDPNQYIGRGLDKSERLLSDVASLLGAVSGLRGALDDLAKFGRASPWVAYAVKEKPPLTVLLISDRRLAVLHFPRTIQLRFLSQGYAIGFDFLGAFKEAAVQKAHEQAEAWLDNLEKKSLGERPVAASPWQAFALRLQAGTSKLVSVIDLAGRQSGPAASEARSGVAILRRALELDRRSIPVNPKLGRLRDQIIGRCPPGQAVCKDGAAPEGGNDDF